MTPPSPLRTKACTVLAGMLVLLAGCTGSQSPVGVSSDAAIPSNPADTPEPARQEPQIGTNGTSPAWPEIGDATIRPGTRIAPDGPPGACTTGFLFVDGNGTLYLSTAAHCFVDHPVGTAVWIQGAEQPGRLVYASWQANNITCAAPITEPTPSFNPLCADDMALIEIAKEDRNRAHPAILHFGGPTGVADYVDIRQGDSIRLYGNSATRGDVEPGRHLRGVITESARNATWQIFGFYTAPGVIIGDSGTGITDADGRAYGQLIATVLPGSGEGVGASLAMMLEGIAAHVGDLQLATWVVLANPI